MSRNPVHPASVMPEPLLSPAEIQALLHGVVPEYAAHGTSIRGDSETGADGQGHEDAFLVEQSTAQRSKIIAI